MFGWSKKQGYEVVIEGRSSFVTEPGETVLNGALRSGIAFPHSCKVGGCASCMCQLVSGKVKELTDKTYLLTKEELEQGFILGCQSVPRSNVTLRLPARPVARRDRGSARRIPPTP